MITYGFGVSLGPLDRVQIQKIRAWRNDPQIYKWCRQTDLIADADQEDWFERQRKDPGTRMYLIHAAGGDPVGVCGLTSIDHINRRAEFSLYIAPEHQKAGLGRLALQTLLTHGFSALNLHVIWGETFDGNPAAKMFEALGMKCEGTRRAFYFKEGRYLDAHLYSVLSFEWAALLRTWGESGVPAGPAHAGTVGAGFDQSGTSAPPSLL